MKYWYPISKMTPTRATSILESLGLGALVNASPHLGFLDRLVTLLPESIPMYFLEILMGI
jgi:hypothetical protein